MKRLFPQPLLSLGLAGFWLMLNNSLSLNSVLFALILGLAVPLVTAPFRQDRARRNTTRRKTPRLKRPLLIAEFIAVVLWDIVRANITVTGLILFRRAADLRPGFIAVPVGLRAPEAVTLLAGTITLTPGTVTADLSADGRSLLVHSLHAPDPDAVRREIKTRYERRIAEMFG